MVHRGVGVIVLVLAIGLAGCGTGEGDGAADDPLTEEPREVADDDAAEGEAPTFAGRLALLPQVPLDGAVEVRMAAVDRTAALAGLSWPPAGVLTVEEIIRLTGGGVEAGEAPIWLPPAEMAALQIAGAEQEAFAAAAGWSLADLDWFAEVLSPPYATMVGGGRVTAAALHDAVGGDEEGPWRTAEGDDLAPDLDGDRLLDPLGRPLTMTIEGEVLGVSRTAEGLRALRGDGPSLADDALLLELAALADEEGCYAVVLYTQGGIAQMICQLPDVDPGAAMLLAAAGVADAEAAAASVAEALDEGQSVGGARYDDLVTDVEVGTADGLVLVRLRAAEGRSPIVGYQMLHSRDPLLPGTVERAGG